MRIMGLDYGSKTVGVAVSDALGYTAQGVEIIRRDSENKLRKTLARLEELVKEKEIGLIVLGYPKHLNNSEGDRCQRTLEFMELLKKRIDLEVVLWDERLTTVAADMIMDEVNIKKDKRNDHVDKIAAILILEGYLRFKENQSIKEKEEQ